MFIKTSNNDIDFSRIYYFQEKQTNYNKVNQGKQTNKKKN